MASKSGKYDFLKTSDIYREEKMKEICEGDDWEKQKAVIDHIQAIQDDVRGEIKQRINQRDSFAIQYLVSVGAIITATLSTALEVGIYFLLIAPLLAIFYSTQILYSYSMTDKISTYIAEKLDPPLEKLLGTDEWESYSWRHKQKTKTKTTGIRKDFFRGSMWIITILALCVVVAYITVSGLWQVWNALLVFGAAVFELYLCLKIEMSLYRKKEFSLKKIFKDVYKKLFKKGEKMVMKNSKLFAFDVDGCLVDKKMQLIDGAPELVSSIMKNIPDAEFCIASGASLFEVELAVRLVQENLPKGQVFSPNIIAHGGGYVKLSGGNEVLNPISSDELGEMTALVNKIDPLAAICYRTKTVNFYIQNNLPSNILAIMATLPKSFGILEHKETPEFLQKQIEGGEIFGLEIIAHDNSKVFEVLQKRFAEKGYVISMGTCVEINKMGKVTALKTVFGDLNKVTYFGDGYNDIPCFKVCGQSFGIGANKEVVKFATYQVSTHLDSKNILFGREKEIEMGK